MLMRHTPCVPHTRRTTTTGPHQAPVSSVAQESAWRNRRMFRGFFSLCRSSDNLTGILDIQAQVDE